jgi:hypothetical protein
MQATESMVIVAEMRGSLIGSCAALEHQIGRMISLALRIASRYDRVTSEHWIVKSTDGKISRSETRLGFIQEFMGLTCDKAQRDQ